MRKICLPVFFALSVITGPAFADQTNQLLSVTNSSGKPQQFEGMTAEERAAKIQQIRKMHGLTNAPLSLTPEERRTRVIRRIEELHRKEAAGTLTPVERKQLELLQRATNRAPAVSRAPVPKGPTPGTTNFNFLSK